MDQRNDFGETSGRPAVEEWQAYYARSIPEIESLGRRIKGPAEVAIMRSSQLDAGRLDTELTSMLQEQLLKAFSFLQPRFMNALRPELALLLDFLIYWFSIWRGKPTPGLALMNLRYRDERSPELNGPPIGARTGVDGPGLSRLQRITWGLAFVFGRYFWTRLETVAAAFHWADQPDTSNLNRAWHWIQRIETAYKLLSFGNLILFLRYGKFRNLVERAIGSRLVYNRAYQPRALSFEYLNRQLIWHELSELVLFILPLVNLDKLKRAVRRVLPSLPSTPSNGLTSSVGGGSCQICKRKDAVVPFIAQPCHHTFCYFCLRSQTEHERGYRCPTCNEIVLSMRRHNNAIAADPG